MDKICSTTTAYAQRPRLPATIQLDHLLIFARLPKPGTNKTRLIPALGAEKATLVYRNLAERTMSRARQLGGEKACLATVCFTGGTVGEAQAEFGDDLAYGEQIGSSLGDRLQHASRSAFDAGAKKVIIIGTDCPSLTSNCLLYTSDAADE